MKTFFWLVRREFWESRAIWIAPAIIGMLLNLAALFGRIDIVTLSSGAEAAPMSGAVLFLFGLAFFVVMSIYSNWYLLDCLYSDRRDRSILFWKSLPVSDTVTVLSKLFTGVIAIPLVYFLMADASTLSMAFIVSIRAHSMFGNSLWQPGQWLQLQGLWLYLIVTMAVWYLPLSGWLLVVSAWAKRAVVLWSFLPLLALCVIEAWFLGTGHIGTVLEDRLVDYVHVAFAQPPAEPVPEFSSMGMWLFGGDVWKAVAPVKFLSSPATWYGLVAGTALIFGAVQLRSRRGEM